MRPGGMGEGNELMNNIRRQAVSRSRGKGIDEERIHQNQVKLDWLKNEKRIVKREAQKEEIRRLPLQIFVSEVVIHELNFHSGVAKAGKSGQSQETPNTFAKKWCRPLRRCIT